MAFSSGSWTQVQSQRTRPSRRSARPPSRRCRTSFSTDGMISALPDYSSDRIVDSTLSSSLARSLSQDLPISFGSPESSPLFSPSPLNPPSFGSNQQYISLDNTSGASQEIQSRSIGTNADESPTLPAVNTPSLVPGEQTTSAMDSPSFPNTISSLIPTPIRPGSFGTATVNSESSAPIHCPFGQDVAHGQTAAFVTPSGHYKKPSENAPPESPTFPVQPNNPSSETFAAELGQWIDDCKSLVASYEADVRSWEVQEKYLTEKYIARLHIELLETKKMSTESIHKTSRISHQRLLALRNTIDQAEREWRGHRREPGTAKPDNEFPTEFYCPITLDVMNEPVLAADGHTYEKQAIEAHFRHSGGYRRTWANSPLTNERIGLGLIPNYSMLSMIQRWKSESTK